jgi:hypothetical protein
MWQSIQPRGRSYGTWKVMWQVDMEGDVASDCASGWCGPMVGFQWPSHGLPRGSGKMPNEGPKPNFKNKKGATKSCGQTTNSDESKQHYKLGDSSNTYIYNNNPKGEAHGLDPGTSPYPTPYNSIYQ